MVQKILVFFSSDMANIYRWMQHLRTPGTRRVSDRHGCARLGGGGAESARCEGGAARAAHAQSARHPSKRATPTRKATQRRGGNSHVGRKICRPDALWDGSKSKYVDFRFEVRAGIAYYSMCYSTSRKVKADSIKNCAAPTPEGAAPRPAEGQKALRPDQLSEKALLLIDSMH